MSGHQAGQWRAEQHLRQRVRDLTGQEVRLDRKSYGRIRSAELFEPWNGIYFRNWGPSAVVALERLVEDIETTQAGRAE